MQGAVFALVVNIAVAALFAASFAVLAFTNPSHRRAAGFAVSYAIGMMTPISEFLLPLFSWPAPFMIASYFCFAAGLLAMPIALSIFYRKPAPWKMAGAIFLSAVVLRWLLWGGVRNTMPYEFLFQLPFFFAAALSCWVIFRARRSGALEVAAMVMFGLVALHFPLKSFLAVAFGSGQTAVQYTASTYALLSQASTGILLTATGLLVLLVTVQDIIRESKSASETDALSGLANRRGFDLHAARVLAHAAQFRGPVSITVFDIDHFKKINDTFGHAAGDRVIRSFSELLRRTLPTASVIGRIGGEEFAVLAERTSKEVARLSAEAVRIATAQQGEADLPPFTVSGGVTEILPGEMLSEAMRRADTALYEAKRQGRDRIRIADMPGDTESRYQIS
ncbi:MAG: diguanylate cyclase [Xanthobacteraceae bacterium]|jgi:diguanylate cyclase (GGDEF)-like protein